MTATSEQSDDLDWQSFFQEYQVFAKKRDAQKARGINDYSLLASILDVNDEVRLHSRFLYSLLNPHGNHYQGSLFLELFLKQAQLQNYLNLDKCWIHKEKNGIDLYLTDGINHVIIENKLDAKDQWQQVKNYIEKVQNKCNTLNIVFIYLSKDRMQPSSGALGEYSININEGYLQNSEKTKFPYKNIHYKKHILEWLVECKKETLNLNNLYNAIREYEQVVLKVIGCYRSPVMNIEDFLRKENRTLDVETKINIILEIEKQLPRLRNHWLDTAMTTGIDDFMSDYPVTKLIKDQFIELDGHIFHQGVADSVFSRLQKRPKNRAIKKGSLWKIDIGEHKDKLALILWMDTSWLHVGIVPISKQQDGSFIFTKNDDIDQGIEYAIKKVTEGVFVDNEKMEKRRLFGNSRGSHQM